MGISIGWMESVIIPRHVLICCEYKVVQAGRKVCVAIDALVDRIVFETDIQNSRGCFDNGRCNPDECGRCKSSAECRACDLRHEIGGAAAEARASERKAGTRGGIRNEGIEQRIVMMNVGPRT